MIKNILSVDVEDWFHPEAVHHMYPVNSWPKLQNRVEENVDKLLQLFSSKNVTATFFVIGWIAKTYPNLICKIVDNGHEIGTHGNIHKMVTKMTPEEFESDLSESIKIIEDVSGQKVLGFRAPTFSIVETTFWSFEIMLKLGLVYDSSIYPIWHDRYGVPHAPRIRFNAFTHNDKVLTEFPMTTIKMFGKNLPFGGGGYLRILPGWLTKKAISIINSKNQPAIMYLHPWEFDVNQPKLHLGLVQSWRHYYNIKNNINKLSNLLDAYSWTSFKNVLDL
jgi:peptidoglycan-N-acetylglucosamine deacetylase